MQYGKHIHIQNHPNRFCICLRWKVNVCKFTYAQQTQFVIHFFSVSTNPVLSKLKCFVMNDEVAVLYTVQCLCKHVYFVYLEQAKEQSEGLGLEDGFSTFEMRQSRRGTGGTMSSKRGTIKSTMRRYRSTASPIIVPDPYHRSRIWKNSVISWKFDKDGNDHFPSIACLFILPITFL